MKRYQYKCTLLSDVVLSSKGATEGFQRSLDYIPGSKFLGIVAGKLYPKKKKGESYSSEEQKLSLDLFHNGHIRYGDAHPYINNQRWNAVPFSWVLPKREKRNNQTQGRKKVFLHHELTLPERKKLIEDDVQLKQARGLFITDYQCLSVSQNFSLKSAFDRKERRSKIGGMFGYHALQAGTEWSFIIDMESDQYLTNINKVLENEHRIGRSKSSQYGLVKVEFLKELSKETTTIEADQLILLYAESNWCFYDENGQNTARPIAADFHCSESEIDWKKSQIRSRNYTTWNKHRRNRDTDRIIIEKGSVIAIRLKNELNTEIFSKGVGAHLNEGFGRVLVNPSFLNGEKHGTNIKVLNDTPKVEKKYIVAKGNEDEFILNFLANRKKQKEDQYNFNLRINQFRVSYKTDLKHISNSQWGQIRKYAKLSGNAETLQNLLFLEKTGFCNRGQSEAVWRKNGARKKLEDIIFRSDIRPELAIDFTIKLASEMAKTVQNDA